MLTVVVLFYSLIEIAARTTTGLQVCPPATDFVTIFDRDTQVPLISVYAGWLGWLNNVDRRDAHVAPTHLYLVVLSTTSTSREQLLVRRNGRAQKWADQLTRHVSENLFPSVSEDIDFGPGWTLHESDYAPKFTKGARKCSLIWRELSPHQLASWSSKRLLPVKFDNIVALDTNMSTGAVELDLCAVPAPPSRQQEQQSALRVGVCTAPFSPFWVWANTFRQFVAWYAVHHGATILLMGRPEDGETMREFARPFVDAKLVTFEIVRWPDLPPAWMNGTLPFAHSQSPWHRFQNGALAHQCFAKYRDHFDWLLRVDFDEYLAIAGPTTTLPSFLSAVPQSIENVAFAMIAHRAQKDALAFNTTVFETFLRLAPGALTLVLPAVISPDHWRYWTWKMAVRTNASLGYYTVHGVCDVTNETVLVADPKSARLMHAAIGEAPIDVVRKWEVDWSVENVQLRQAMKKLDAITNVN